MLTKRIHLSTTSYRLLVVFFGVIPATLGCVMAYLISGMIVPLYLSLLFEGGWRILYVYVQLLQLFIFPLALWGTVSLWALTIEPELKHKFILWGLIAGIVVLPLSWYFGSRDAMPVLGPAFLWFVAAPELTAVALLRSFFKAPYET